MRLTAVSPPASIGGRAGWNSLGRGAIMYFTIIGTRGRWLKRKGVAEVRLASGELVRAELHWYECGGIGKREFKIKRFLKGDQT